MKLKFDLLQPSCWFKRSHLRPSREGGAGVLHYFGFPVEEMHRRGQDATNRAPNITLASDAIYPTRTEAEDAMKKMSSCSESADRGG